MNLSESYFYAASALYLCVEKRWLIDCGESFRDETKKVKKRKKAAKATLSFAMDDEEEGESASTTPKGGSKSPKPAETDDVSDQPAKRAKLTKNPNVDTSFLPDRDREEEERKERERLRQEWLRKQEEMKQEEIEIVYSFWDGSGHRKSVTVCYFLFILN